MSDFFVLQRSNLVDKGNQNESSRSSGGRYQSR
jgi:hypothetical protein